MPLPFGRLLRRSVLMSRLSRLVNGPLSRLRYKVGVTLLAMLSYVLVGALLSSHLPFHPETRAPLSFDEGVCWAWSHLTDPGFTTEDAEPLTRPVIGSVFAVGGLMMVAGVFFAVVTELAKVGVSRVVDGYLPRGLQGHTVLVGSARALRSLSERARDVWGEGVEDLVCVVSSAEELLTLRKTVDVDMFITHTHLQDDDSLHTLSLVSARRLVLLEGATPNFGDLIELLRLLQRARAEALEERRRRRREPLAQRLRLRTPAKRNT